MGDSFITLWSKDRIQNIKKYHQEGARLEVMFGGPHSSLPSFRRYGVSAGDLIYPVRVSKGVLYLIGRMKVRRIITLKEYIEQNPDLFGSFQESEIPMVTLINYLSLHPERQYLAPTCADEVVTGEEGTAIQLDVIVPPDMLNQLRFRSQKRERGLKHIVNGKLTKAITIQGGYYRLTETTAQELKALLMNTLNLAKNKE